VDNLIELRRALLGVSERRSATSLAGGRLLVYLPDENVFDGAAKVATNGFFNQDNIPPWDTWVAYFYDNANLNYLVSWIHPDLIAIASEGIRVNPEACIRWLDDFDGRVKTLVSLALPKEYGNGDILS
jgi:hypothetical protein